jgi:hypothetical protein
MQHALYKNVKTLSMYIGNFFCYVDENGNVVYVDMDLSHPQLSHSPLPYDYMHAYVATYIYI